MLVALQNFRNEAKTLQDVEQAWSMAQDMLNMEPHFELRCQVVYVMMDLLEIEKGLIK